MRSPYSEAITGLSREYLRNMKALVALEDDVATHDAIAKANGASLQIAVNDGSAEVYLNGSEILAEFAKKAGELAPTKTDKTIYAVKIQEELIRVEVKS